MVVGLGNLQNIQLTYGARMQETQTSLNKEQKWAILLLSAGTFLEYFDLMLYVHMAVLLNELFFPKTDPFTASLMSALAFCSTYIMRPLGALILGWIGDHVGRKHTVIITTILMACSCITMALLPTYAQIGITASWAVTICRIIQGLSSIGEITGSQLYLTEITKPPVQYPVVASVLLVASLGSVTALGTASFCFAHDLNWRIAFLVGAGIALVGTYARSVLRETPEFADAKRRMKKVFEQANKDPNSLEESMFLKEKVSKKMSLALFLIDCGNPAFFYITYVHFGNFLKMNFAYSGAQVISHNFIVGITYLICASIQCCLTYFIHPLKVLKIRLIMFIIFMISFPYLLTIINVPFHVMLIQMCFIVLSPTNYPIASVLFIHFPIFKRFTYAGVIHAVSHAIIYVITSFGLIYLVSCFGQLGILFIATPVCLGFIFGLRHFEALEKVGGNYHHTLNR